MPGYGEVPQDPRPAGLAHPLRFRRRGEEGDDGRGDGGRVFRVDQEARFAVDYRVQGAGAPAGDDGLPEKRGLQENQAEAFALLDAVFHQLSARHHEDVTFPIKGCHVGDPPPKFNVVENAPVACQRA